MTTETIKIISTENAPSAIGPYSQATKANGFVFCSGQIALTQQQEPLWAMMLKHKPSKY